MKNKLKKYVRSFGAPSDLIVRWDGTMADRDILYFKLYLKHPIYPEIKQYYYSAIKYDPTNPDWINMVCKARIGLLDYAVERWGDKPWEAM